MNLPTTYEGTRFLIGLIRHDNTVISSNDHAERAVHEDIWPVPMGTRWRWDKKWRAILPNVGGANGLGIMERDTIYNHLLREYPEYEVKEREIQSNRRLK